jgi:hypothetical protein
MGNIILLWVLFLFCMSSVVVFLVSIGGGKMVKKKSGSLFMYMMGVIWRCFTSTKTRASPYGNSWRIFPG